VATDIEKCVEMISVYPSKSLSTSEGANAQVYCRANVSRERVLRVRDSTASEANEKVDYVREEEIIC
jgi:hypothetical protein